MKPVITNYESDEKQSKLRIENKDGEVIYGPTASFTLPLFKDENVLEVVFDEANMGQPQRDMWRMLFGIEPPEYEQS